MFKLNLSVIETVALLIIAGVIISGAVAVSWYFSSTVVVTVTSTIMEKHITTDTDVIVIPGDSPIGIPINSRDFTFIMENGDLIDVPQEIFCTYFVGDRYTYSKRVWR